MIFETLIKITYLKQVIQIQGNFDGGCKSSFVRNFFPVTPGANEGDRDLLGFDSTFLKKFAIPLCLFVAVFSPN
jgi:hypothetical protein